MPEYSVGGVGFGSDYEAAAKYARERGYGSDTIRGDERVDVIDRESGVIVARDIPTHEAEDISRGSPAYIRAPAGTYDEQTAKSLSYTPDIRVGKPVTIEYDYSTGAAIQITGATQEQINQQRNVERAISQGKLQATERESLREQILGITSARESARKQREKEFEKSFKLQVSTGTQQFLLSKQQALSLFERQESLNKVSLSIPISPLTADYPSVISTSGPPGSYKEGTIFRPLTTLEQKYTPEGRIDIFKEQGPPSIKSRVATKAIFGNPIEQTAGSLILFGLPKAAKALPSAIGFGALTYVSPPAAAAVGLGFLPSFASNIQTSMWEKGFFRTLGEEGPTLGLFVASGRGGAKLREYKPISSYYNKAVKGMGGKIEIIEDTGESLFNIKLPAYKRTFQVEKVIGIGAIAEKEVIPVWDKSTLKTKTDFQFITETKITKRISTPKPRADFPARFEMEQVGKAATENVIGKPISMVEISKSAGILKVENPLVKKPSSAKDIFRPLKQESLNVEQRLIEKADLEVYKLSDLGKRKIGYEGGKSARLYSFSEQSDILTTTQQGRVFVSSIKAKPISRKQAQNILKPKINIPFGSRVKKSRIKVYDFRQKKVDLKGGTLAGISMTTKGTKVKPLVVDTNIPESRQIAIQRYSQQQKYYNVKPILSVKKLTGKRFKPIGYTPSSYEMAELEYDETYQQVKGLPTTSPIIKTYQISQARTPSVAPSFNFNIKSAQTQIPRAAISDIQRPSSRQLPFLDIVPRTKPDTKPIIDIGLKPKQDTLITQIPKITQIPEQITTTTPPPRTPPPTTFILPSFGRKQAGRKPRKQSNIFSPFNPKYIPSLGAAIFNIRGKKPSKRLYTTGLTLRPLPLLMKRRKRR